jgi:regulator of protease activity HflC (stomatin/prohibitin superfamily)
MDAFTFLITLFAALIAVFAVKGFKIVQQAETIVIERLGRYHRTLESGVNIIWPMIDRPRRINWRYRKIDVNGNQLILDRDIDRIDLREQVFDFARQNVITADNVTIEINAMLYFQIMDPIKAVYEINNLPNAIEKLTQTTLRNVIGEMALDACLSSRDTINAKMRGILDDATDKWGVKVSRVELQDISPPHDIQEAMEKQMRAERDRRAAILIAEGDKKSKILEAEGRRESEVNIAEGEKQAAILRATGDAEARIRIAEAEAEAIQKIVHALEGEKGDPANYLIAVRYIETLGEMVSGKDNKVIYLPYEATGVLSSIGGIKDMLTGSKD